MLPFGHTLVQLPLREVDDFVIITEELHEDFDKFTAALPSCDLQLASLLQHWNWHVRESPALVTILFENQYVVLHYSEMDELCEWVIKTREEYGNRADLGTHTGLQNEGKEVRDLTNCDKKLWKVVGNIQLYETDRYCIHLHSNVMPVILLSILL